MNAAQGKWDRLSQWVESVMHGRITRRERQPRNRPAWYFDVEVNGTTVPLYWRGYRGNARDNKPSIYDRYPIEREAKLLQVLEGAGIPVPHVYGFCPDPKGILMQRAPGSADFHHIVDEQEREAVARHFMETLARTHRIPPEVFESIGMVRPRTRDEQALNDLDIWEEQYRGAVTEPAPFIEFTLRWLRRNVPRNAGRTVLVQADTGPGNFLSQDGRVTAVLDWEFAHLGDPMYDLAQIRGRALTSPFGNLRERFQLYSQLSGNPVDLEALRYYSVRGLLMTPLALEPLLQEPHPSADVPEFLSWYMLYARATVECLAEAIGIHLEPVPIPDPEATPRSKIFDVVLANLKDEQLPQISDAYCAYRLRTTIRLVEYLRLAEQLGPAMDSSELDDLEAVLAYRPASLAEGQAALERLIIAAGPERDGQLVRHFYRHFIRQEAMLKPAMGEMAVTGNLSPIE
jgi:aminoglycoside phosphotransferase (APT) family kinase protein